MNKHDWRFRLEQAIQEINDTCVFSEDQITKLNNMIILLKWGIDEAMKGHPRGQIEERALARDEGEAGNAEASLTHNNEANK